MKKYFSLLVVAVMSICTFAQDIIVTKDSKKIDAKILEVSKNEIKYKEKDYLDGPTFVLETKEISSIIYANGKVVLYNKEEKSDIDKNEQADQKSYDMIGGITFGDTENAYKYISEDGQVILVYNKEEKQMYLQTNKPLMHNSYEARNITLTVCHFGDKKFNLVFDLANKVNGVALLSGIHAFLSNLDFQRYFKKHMPKSFVIDIPYETQQESYKMKLSN